MSKSNVVPALLIAVAIIVAPLISSFGLRYFDKTFPGLRMNQFYEKEQSRKAREMIDLRDELKISEVQLIKNSGRGNAAPRLIGTISNNGEKAAQYVQLQLVVRDKDGKLLDVSQGEMGIQGVLLPGEQSAFSIPLHSMDPEHLQAENGFDPETMAISVTRLQVID